MSRIFHLSPGTVIEKYKVYLSPYCISYSSSYLISSSFKLTLHHVHMWVIELFYALTPTIPPTKTPPPPPRAPHTHTNSLDPYISGFSRTPRLLCMHLGQITWQTLKALFSFNHQQLITKNLGYNIQCLHWVGWGSGSFNIPSVEVSLVEDTMVIHWIFMSHLVIGH